jgi:dephospho-CoA kinase
MYLVYLIGNLASGKSSVAHLMREHGAAIIDLDEVSREVLAPTSSLLFRVVDEFGKDLIDPHTGLLDRGLLARRAFACPKSAARLEALELPAIKEALLGHLKELRGHTCCCVVEIPLPDRMGTLLDLADEVLEVRCPLELRRERAHQRGMEEGDFERRAARQLSDADLSDLADTFIDNGDGRDKLVQQINAWWDRHEALRWQRKV